MKDSHLPDAGRAVRAQFLWRASPSGCLESSHCVSVLHGGESLKNTPKCAYHRGGYRRCAMEVLALKGWLLLHSVPHIENMKAIKSQVNVRVYNGKPVVSALSSARHKGKK